MAECLFLQKELVPNFTPRYELTTLSKQNECGLVSLKKERVDLQERLEDLTRVTDDRIAKLSNEVLEKDRKLQDRRAQHEEFCQWGWEQGAWSLVGAS